MKYVGEEIYNIIPNRYPLMLLETLEVEGKKAVSEIKLKGDEWFFACHYPGNPMMPLSLIIESMTQTFEATFLTKTDSPEIPIILSLGGGDKIAIQDKLVPGDMLRMESYLKLFGGGIAKGVCKAYKNDNETPLLEFSIIDALPSQMNKIL